MDTSHSSSFYHILFGASPFRRCAHLLCLIAFIAAGCQGGHEDSNSTTTPGSSNGRTMPANNLTGAHGWSYEEKNAWPDEYKDCHGAHQSPIAIKTSTTIRNFTFAPIKFSDGYKNQPSNVSIINNGHTVQITISENASISGGPLRGTYNFAQLHFHWGGNDTIGSEHTVDGHRFPLELHLVHYGKNFGSFNKALGQKEGVVVFGVWFDTEGGNHSNKILTPLVKSTRKIRAAGDTTSVDGMVGIRNFLPDDVSSYYYYEGSLTTPTCTENVLWIIFRQTQPISHDQLTAFRRLWEEKAGSPVLHQLQNNFRKVQPLNGRNVYMVGGLGSKILSEPALLFLLMAVAGIPTPWLWKL